MTRYFLFFCTLSLLLSLEPMASSAAADSPTDSTGFELASDGKVLVVRAQTADEAYGHLVGVLEDMEFYRANGYDVALPDHPAFATDAKPIGRGEKALDPYLASAPLTQVATALERYCSDSR